MKRLLIRLLVWLCDPLKDQGSEAFFNANNNPDRSVHLVRVTPPIGGYRRFVLWIKHADGGYQFFQAALAPDASLGPYTPGVGLPLKT